MTAGNQLVAALLTMAVLAGTGLAAVRALGRPRVVPSDAPAGMFSADRAAVHIDRIARAPHPVGSAEHEHVRRYLERELARLGLRVHVQRAIVANELPDMKPGSVMRFAAEVANVIGVLPGTPGSAQRPLVLLVAHYDSVAAGPGANDNGAGVAALLETARALSCGPAGPNDVAFLFTDAEEVGQLGARAFVDGSELAGRTGVVLNFEARGRCGPVLMFETGPHNAPAIRLFGKATRRAYTSSLLHEVYRRMPNMTDFGVFRGAGVPGYNFAYLAGYTHYHSELDTPESVGRRSLQHHGEYALRLAHRLARTDLRALRGDRDAAFFTVPGGRVLRYPAVVSLPLTALAVLAWVVALLVGLTHARIGAGAVLIGAAAGLAAPLVLVLLGLLSADRLMGRHTEYAYYGHTAAGSTTYFAGLVLTALAAASLLPTGYADRADLPGAALGALLWWVVLAALTATAFTGANYLFAWPALAASIGLIVVLAHPTPPGWAALTAALLLTTLPAYLVIPIVYLTFVGLSIKLSAAPLLVAALLGDLLVVPLGVLGRPIGLWLPVSAAVAATVCLVVARRLSAPRRERRPVRGRLYALDRDTGRAVVAQVPTGRVTDAGYQPGAEPDRLPEFFGDRAERFTRRPAPAVPLAAPSVELVGTERCGESDRVTLRIWAPPGALSTVVWTDSAVLDYDVEGVPAHRSAPGEDHEPGPDWTLWLYAVPPAGRLVTLVRTPGQPATVRVTARFAGLPDLAHHFTVGHNHCLAAPDLGLGVLCNATFVSRSARIG